MAKSYEERIEFETKKELENYGITLFEKNQPINQSIQEAFKKYPSKSGGSGINYPDIQLQLETDNIWDITLDCILLQSSKRLLAVLATPIS